MTVTLSITVVALPPTQAAVKTWQGAGGSSSFSTATNWGTGGAPGSGDTASFTGSTATTCNITASTTVGAITVSGNATLAITAGQTLTVNGDYTQTSNNPTVAVSGGVLQITGAFNQSAGVFTQSSGTVLLDATGAKNLVTHTASFFNLAINDGLMAYWKLDDSATPSIDSSGWGRNGTWASGATSSTTVPTLNFSNSRSLSVPAGVNDMVTFTSPTVSAITVAAWVYSTSRTTTFPRILDMPAFELSFSDAAQPVPSAVAWTATAVTGTYSYRSPASSVGDGAWYHIAATFDAGANAQIFINGVNQMIAVSGTLGSGGIASNSGTGIIGNNATPTGTRPWNGRIDDLRIYNRVLDDSEIYSLFIGNQPGTGSAVQTLSGTPTVSNDLILGSGTLSVGSGNLTVSGSWNNYGGLFTAGSSTVTLNSTTGDVIRSAGQPFNGLILNGMGATWTLEDWLRVNGSLTMTNGALSPGAYAVHVADLNRTSGTLATNTGAVVIDPTSTPAGTGTGFGLTFNTLRIETPNEANLLGYWKLDEGQGPTTRDATGAGYTGTLGSDASWVASSLPTNIAFDNHAAIKLNGTSDYVSLGSPAALNFTGQITMAAWVNNLSTTGNERNVIAHGHDGNNEVFLRAYNGSYQTGSYQNPTTYYATYTFPGGDIGTWVHLAGVYDGTTWRLYRNGAQVASSVQAVGAVAVSANWAIGARGDGTSRFFSGQIDDVRIYNTGLTAAQVLALYNGGYAGTGGGTTVTLGANLTVNGELAIDSGTLATSSFTINAGATDSSLSSYVNAGTLAVGSSRATFNGGLVVNAQGTVTENTVGGAIALGPGEQLAYLNLSGTIQGFPTAAFDWNSFTFWREYVTYRSFVSGSTTADTVVALSADGGTKYSWALPSSMQGSLLGTPRWNTEGTMPAVHYIYLITTLGYVYKVLDSGSALTTVGGWPYHNTTGGAAASATSPLVSDSSNLYWSGNDGGGLPKIFSLTLAGGLNAALAVTSTVSAAPALATVGLVPYVFFAISGKVYQETLTFSSQYTSTQPTTAVNGRISFNGSVLYFPENNGTVWALNSTNSAGPTTASGWPYQDRSGARHLAACTGGSFVCPPVSNIYVDIAQNRICFGDQDGHVYVLNSSGVPLTGFPWQPGSAADNFQAPPLSRNGVLLIGAANGNVYEIDENNGTTRALTRTYTLPGAISGISYNPSANGGSGGYAVGVAGKLYYLGVGSDPSGPI